MIERLERTFFWRTCIFPFSGKKIRIIGTFILLLLLTGIRQGFSQVTLPKPQPRKDTGQVIHLLNADILKGIQGKKGDSSEMQKLIGNVRLQQGETIFLADSAIRYMKKNVLDAYGNIHINQADSINTYADELHYRGNSKIATLKKNVKMTDGNMVLTTNFLDYNLKTHVGTYYRGGKLVNQETILTSEKGVYYADTKDVYFKENVKLNNPEYKVTTDTLLYNTVSHTATFLSPTAINTGATIIYTSCGYYETDQQYSFLCDRPTIVDSTGTLTADSMTFSKEKGLGKAYESIVWQDSSGQATVQSNYAISNNQRKTLLATKEPLLIFSQGKDTLFVTSDTLFSGPVIPIITKEDSLRLDSIDYVYVPKSDSERVSQLDSTEDTFPGQEKFNRLKKNLPIIPSKRDTISIRPPLILPTSNKDKDLNKKQKKISDKKVEKQQKRESIEEKKDDILENKTVEKPELDSTSMQLSSDSINTIIAKIDTGNIKHLDSPITVDSSLTASSDSLKHQEKKTIDTSKARNLIAYYNVKLYSDSLQGIADSLYYSDLDSSFHFYGNPVLWTGETQLTGDTIVLVTKNQKPYKLILQQHAMIVNKVGPDQYNQIQGRVITGYFNDSSQLDWMNVEGNAESLYYAQEDSTGAVIGINKATASFIKLFFKDNGLNQVKFYKNIQGTFENPSQIKKEDLKLKGFRWESDKRPPQKPKIHRIKEKVNTKNVPKERSSRIENPPLQ